MATRLQVNPFRSVYPREFAPYADLPFYTGFPGAIPQSYYTPPAGNRYGFGGAESTVTETNAPTTENGEPSLPEETRDDPNDFNNPLSFLKPMSADDRIKVITAQSKLDEDRTGRELSAIKDYQLEVAENMFKFGAKSTLLASLLKDVPKAFSGPSQAYNDVMQNILLTQQAAQPLLYAGNRGNIPANFSNSFRTG